MSIEDTTGTTWGKRPNLEDVRALRRYNTLLSTLAKAGEVTVYSLMAVVVIFFLWFLFTGNFENVRFTDGTNLSCILNGSTGEIVNVD